MAINNKKQTFSIAGKLDISDIISKSNQLREKLKKNLNVDSFKQIEKEYEKLQQALSSYQQIMSRSFSDQTDIRNAQKALNSFYQTMSKFTSLAQSLTIDKNINLAPDLAKQLREEAKAIEQEQKKISTTLENWQNSLKNSINAANISKNDKQVLLSSIFDEKEFSKQINRISRGIVDKAKELVSSIRNEYERIPFEIDEAKTIAQSPEASRKQFLKDIQKRTYSRAQSETITINSKIAEQEKEATQLRTILQNSKAEFDREIYELRELEKRAIEARQARTKAEQAVSLYQSQHPSATVKNDEEFRKLQESRVSASAGYKVIKTEIGDRSSEKLLKQRNQKELRLKQLDTDLQKLYNALNQAQNQMDELDKEATQLAEERVINLENRAQFLKNQIHDLIEQAKKTRQEVRNTEPEQKKYQSITNEQTNLDQRSNALREQIELARQVKVTNSGIEDSIKSLDSVSNDQRKNDEEYIKTLEEKIKENQKLEQTFDSLKENIKIFLSVGSGFQLLKQVIRSTFEDVKKLDAAFASIAMVTDYSVEEMWASYDDYAKMANRLGQSTKDVIASSALFYQQGLNTAEALELTESTMKLATLAGSDFETATSQMTAA